MKLGIIVAATLVCSSLAFCQMGGPRHVGPGGPHEFGFRSGKVVIGAPYSADMNDASVKTLADGNSIQRTTIGRVARDSQGRTYSEETMKGMWGQSGTKTITFISDPVAGFVYTLNADTKTATRRALHVREGTHTLEARPANPAVVSADLGTQMVNGVNAQGKKVTHTIPAGEMGNSQPIISTNETWFSPDLQVVISAKRVEPREATSVYTLNNIQRSEPLATLFQVPSDYTIKDAAGFEHGGLGRGGRP